MILAFLYSADVARNDGGCNELLGLFSTSKDAIDQAMIACTTRYDDVVYLDIVETSASLDEATPYTHHYRKYKDESSFTLISSKAIANYTDTRTDGHPDCPY